MDAIALLKADHDKVKKLLSDGEETTERAEKGRTELFATLKEEMLIHERIEEEIFYPALKSHPKAKDIVLEGYEEQRAAWEQQYAEAHARWEAHKRQVEEAENSEVAAAAPASYSSGGSSDGADTPTASPAAPEGSLASDEALQALREKLTGGAV